MTGGRIALLLSTLGVFIGAVLIPGFWFWWGKLPADIVVHVQGNTYMFLPVGSCVFASLLISGFGWLWRKTR